MSAPRAHFLLAHPLAPSQSLGRSTLNIHWKDDAKAKALVFWSSDANRWFIRKVPGKDQRQKETRASEDRRHHWCNERELGQTLGSSEGQGGLACCSPWDHEESDTTGRLNKAAAAKSGPQDASGLAGVELARPTLAFWGPSKKRGLRNGHWRRQGGWLEVRCWLERSLVWESCPDGKLT